MIQVYTALVGVCDTKVIDPATKILAQFGYLVPHRYPPVPVRQVPYSALEFGHSVWVPLNAPTSKSESKELAVCNLDDLAFGVVDDQLQTGLQVSADTMQYSIARARGLDQDGEVIRVSGKLVVAFLKFFIEWVQHNVRQQRGQRTALWDTFPALFEELVIDKPSSQIALDQPEETLVVNLAAQQCHEQVMINTIKEF